MFNNFWQDKIYNPLANAVKNTGESLGNIFKGIGDMKVSPTNPLAGTTPSQKYPGYYQIKPQDTDLNSIAESTGVPLPELVDLNGGTQTIPPAGSYIQIAQQQRQGDGRGVLVPQQNTNSTPTVAGQNDGRGGAYFHQIAVQRDQVNTAFNQFQETYRLTGQMDMTLLPQTMNLSVIKELEKKGFFPGMDAAGNPLTPSQIMNQYGYQWDGTQYVRTGQPGGSQTANTPNYSKPSEGMVMDNKFVAVRKGNKIVWVNMKKEKPVSAPVAQPAANAADSPSTTVGLNVGSG